MATQRTKKRFQLGYSACLLISLISSTSFAQQIYKPIPKAAENRCFQRELLENLRRAPTTKQSSWEEVYPSYYKPFKLPQVRPSFEVHHARLKELGLTEHLGDPPWEITPLPGTFKTPLAAEISKLNTYRKVRFFDEASDIDGIGFHVEEKGDEIRVHVSSTFFEDPNEALVQLRNLETKIALADRLAKKGIRATFPDYSSTERLGLSITIPKKQSFPNNDPRQWIKNRTARHDIHVVVNDSKFVGVTEKYVAFTQYDTVYLRSATIENIEKSGPFIGHELLHATNYVKCLRYLDCGPVIEFRGTATNPNPFSNELYGHFFRSDETEANFVTALIPSTPVSDRETKLLSQLRNEIAAGKHATTESSMVFVLNTPEGELRIPIDLNLQSKSLSQEELRNKYIEGISEYLGESRPFLVKARKFGLEQRSVLESLRNEIAAGKHTVNQPNPRFIVNSSLGPVDVAFNLVVGFATEDEARQFYLKIIDARMRSIGMRLKAIDKRLQQSPNET